MRVPDDAEGPRSTLPTLPPLLHLTSRLEQAWQATSSSMPPPNLADFLPPAGDLLRSAALKELVRLDLEIRWQRGLPILLESYSQQFPELGEASSLPTELIYHEFCVRRLHGDRPSLAQYQSRFPGQYRRLLLVAKAEVSRVAASALRRRRRRRLYPLPKASPFRRWIPPPQRWRRTRWPTRTRRPEICLCLPPGRRPVTRTPSCQWSAATACSSASARAPSAKFGRPRRRAASRSPSSACRAPWSARGPV